MKKNLNILITGGSRGIGNAIATTVSHRAKNLLLTSQHLDSMLLGLEKIQKVYNGPIFHFNLDQSNAPSAADALAEWANSIVDSIDVLVLCAGNYFEGSLMEISDQEFLNTLNTNFISNYYIVKRLYPLLKRGHSTKVIIIGSTAAYAPYEIPTYSIAKYALRGFAANLRQEFIPDNIGVTFISPGGTLTDMWSGVDLAPNRLLMPSDIAKTIDMLLDLSNQAVVEELIVRPMLGDYNE